MDFSKLNDKALAKFARRAPSVLKVLGELPLESAELPPRNDTVANFTLVVDAVKEELTRRNVQWQGAAE